MRILYVVSALALPFSAAADGREMRPLMQVLENLQGDSVAREYFLARCSGLFDGMIRYGGQNYTEEIRREMMYRSSVFAAAAGKAKLQRQQPDSYDMENLERFIELAEVEIDFFSAQYSSRMQMNYALSGSSVADDPLMTDDIQTCQRSHHLTEQYICGGDGCGDLKSSLGL